MSKKEAAKIVGLILLLVALVPLGFLAACASRSIELQVGDWLWGVAGL